MLEEEDIVMFGHPNGKCIKPGEIVTEIPSSEFSFVVSKSWHLVNLHWSGNTEGGCCFALVGPLGTFCPSCFALYLNCY